MRPPRPKTTRSRPRPGRRRRRTNLKARVDLTAGGSLLGVVAEATRLAEGPEGVRRVLRAVLRGGPIPIRDLARTCALPVPVVAAVRGELEARGLMTRKGGLALTPEGVDAVRQHTGLTCVRRFPALPPFQMPDDVSGLTARLESVGNKRPPVDVTLDQSHATPETALRRAVYLYEHDALEGRRLLFLGDDDLTSVAVRLLADDLGFRIDRVVVLERDARLVRYLSERTAELGPVDAIEHDLRNPLPDGLTGQFDVFVTDPPYTLPGLELFVSRGVSGLTPEVGKQGYVCFGHRTPQESAQAIRLLVEMGLAPQEILPGFNDYVGAQLLAGSSQMIRTVLAGEPSPTVREVHTGALYTADRRPKGRHRGP